MKFPGLKNKYLPTHILNIITTFIPYGSQGFVSYINHVTKVRDKALAIASKSSSSLDIKFIEEASLLHDLGICKVAAPQLGFFGTQPYIAHCIIGHNLLLHKGLPQHARVALNHIGVGLTKKRIIQQQLPFPPQNIIARKKEDKIISFADLFFSKNPTRANAKLSCQEVRKRIAQHNPEDLHRFEKWCKEFNECQ